jgi:hypothetical protein
VPPGQPGVAEVVGGEQRQPGEGVAGHGGGERAAVLLGQEEQGRSGGQRQGEQQRAGGRAEPALGQGDQGDQQRAEQELEHRVEHVCDPRTEPAEMGAGSTADEGS